MLVLLPLLFLVAQDDAPGSVGKMAWPPKAPTAQRYVVKTTKTRKLSAATAAQRREAAKTAGVKLPAKDPQQQVAVELLLECTPGAGELKVRSTPRIGEAKLRWKWIEAAPGGAPAVFTNARLAELWGDGAASAPPLEFARASFEAPFERTLRWRPHGLQHDDAGARCAESLLPVLWSRALPTWGEAVLAVLHMDGEHVIPGKALIREHTEIHALGSRTSRAEALIETATSDRLKLSYKLRVDQMVNRTRDLSAVLKRHYLWRFEIEGTLEHSLADGALLAVDEKIVARLVDPSPEKLLEIYDEEFEGTIQLRRYVEEPVDPKGKAKPKPKR
ncbi:MAG: hypothetical protein JNM84_07510 [Planctomycetes bacterium]|nr:hypothetical protein [Planctomycetota bacterium]